MAKGERLSFRFTIADTVRGMKGPLSCNGARYTSTALTRKEIRWSTVTYSRSFRGGHSFGFVGPAFWVERYFLLTEAP